MVAPCLMTKITKLTKKKQPRDMSRFSNDVCRKEVRGVGPNSTRNLKWIYVII